MAKLSKEQRKAMAQKAMDERAKHPQAEKKQSGFKFIEDESTKLGAEKN
ncbi:hypothetical protein ACE83Q_05720 [Dellaglioa sp. P0083]